MATETSMLKNAHLQMESRQGGLKNTQTQMWIDPQINAKNPRSKSACALEYICESFCVYL